jgi:hypothetical protein
MKFVGNILRQKAPDQTSNSIEYDQRKIALS